MHLYNLMNIQETALHWIRRLLFSLSLLSLPASFSPPFSLSLVFVRAQKIERDSSPPRKIKANPWFLSSNQVRSSSPFSSHVFCSLPFSISLCNDISSPILPLVFSSRRSRVIYWVASFSTWRNVLLPSVEFVKVYWLQMLQLYSCSQ
ncbi:hypothetical protein CIPAW_03G085800 [Carya illinoinensis]|uniref:Uncharacterized protein n=1 Tax=Carya illinoinensis TaxID=32201 RepID=A0A8T1R197_CARIL|nr:hypothetical protein CIPAW_03G085800 [Carya illinoinensis]